MLVCACGSAEDTEDSRPRVIDEPNNEVGFTNADYEQHVESLRKTVSQGFTIIIQKPFVVIGDESPDLVKLRAEKTIKWTVDMLMQDYFEKDPYDIIDIWLFKDEKSYYKYAKDIFGDVNEGLASLYEQCGEKNGHIYGYTNWRLKGLQTAIKQGLAPPFKNLFSMSEYEFYTQDKGTNYGQSRYLCYYLQEKGLLVKFYHDFYANRKEDPTGYKTLRNLLGEEDMEVFKNKWEKFVMKLTFP
jgi:hypothetical protein